MKKFIHLIGVEGCGHHGITPIVKDILNQSLFSSPGELIYAPEWLSGLTFNRFPEDELREGLNSVSDGSVVLSDQSYPCGHTQRTTADFLDIVRQCRVAKELGYEVSLLHLRRSMFSAINSHREWDGGLLPHAERIRDAQHHIDCSQSVLRSQGVTIEELWYEDVESDPTPGFLKSFLDATLEETEIKSVISSHFKRSNRVQLTLEEKDHVEQFWPNIWQYEHTVSIEWDCGLFSCCSVSLYDTLSYMKSCNRLQPFRFNIGNQFYAENDTTDVYSELFVEDETIDLDLEKLRSFYFTRRSDHTYKDYDDLNIITPLAKRWFTPNSTVVRLKNKLIANYGIDPGKTLVCYYRSTDKYTETHIADPDIYIKKAKSLFSIGDFETVLVQSDQVQFIEQVQSSGIPVTIIKENKAVSDHRGIHTTTQSGDRISSALTFLATVLLMSECHSIIYSTSNVSRWISIFRGDFTNTWQFNETGFA